MALNNYAALQASIASWLDHDALDATIPDFIAMAEANINRDVRSRDMVTSAELTISSRFTDLPADHLQTIRLDCNGRRLTARSTDDMIQKRYSGSASGQPCFFAPIGSTVEVYPTPDSSYTGTLQYYAAIPALADNNTTNWLLTASPDVYLYGSLIHAAPFLAEDARAGTWVQLYSAAVKNLNDRSNSSGWSSVMSIPARGA